MARGARAGYMIVFPSMKLYFSLAILLIGHGICAADPAPGDVFREYVYGRRFGQVDLGSTRPNIDDMRAGSQVDRRIEIPTLRNVTKAEVSIEYWGGHVGTSNQQFSVNGSQWFAIPQPQGTAKPPECYHRTLLGRATVSIPLEHLKSGTNSFRFNAGPQICHSFNWGFYWVYSFTVRVYYSPSESRQAGRIVSPANNAEIGDNPRIVAEAHRDDTPITSVEFVGRYDDFNWEGDGIFRQWHYITQRGQLAHHIGSATRPPYAVTWDTTWIPDQNEPIEIAARVTDLDGYIHMTPAIKISLRRQGRSVRMYKASEIPTAFASRVGRRRECKINVPDDLANAHAARIVLSTWSAAHGEEINLNRTRLTDRVGLVHNYSFDAVPVPIRLIRTGENIFDIFSTTEHHAAEVNWPGPVLLVEYGQPAKAAADTRPISVQETDCQGQPSFRITTPSATYCYQKEGAAFASIVDPSGAEWIGYKPGGRSAGEFRGIPNLGEFAHPGYSGATGSTSALIDSSPDHVAILSERHDRKYTARWDIYPFHATMTVLTAEKPYWFLYEGTPGGTLDLKSGFQVTSDGNKRSLSERWSGHLPNPRWIYFGNAESPYVLFAARHSNDFAPDQYWPMDGNMTVFGFGREFTCCGRYLTETPARFTIGVVPNGSFDRVAGAISQAIQR